MEAFEYAKPSTTKEAVALLGSQWGETEVLAGGTDLISLMKDMVATPRRVVSLQHVRGLNYVHFNASEGLRLGPMVTVEELIDDPQVRRHYPAIIQAGEGISSPQMRNMGTVGGELLQRPRDWYFRLGYGLLAQENGKSMVVDGDNRYHAILGNSGPAYFVNASTLAPIMIALGATLRLEGLGGSREVDLGKFYVTPKSNDEREYVLRPNEILTEIRVPAPRGKKMGVYEVRQREAMDWPLAAAAAVLQMSGKTVKSARIVLGHVAPVPWPSPEAVQALTGKTANTESATDAGNAAVKNARPLSKNKYKVQLTRVAVKRAILRATEGGMENA